MPAFFREHGLSLGLGSLTVLLVGASIPVEEGWWRDFWMGLGHDAFGATLIVLATKYLRERGSPASK